jgi:oligopeptide transport system substrate-binding protein
MHRFPQLLALTAVAAAAGLLGLAGGCGQRVTLVDLGNRNQILHIGNGDEIEELDPQTSTGIPEHNIISALFEGLVSEDPKDLHPIPAGAESWDISPDRLTYTFHLRKNARWSNGEPITAKDYYRSYYRMLDPNLAAEYSNMLFVVKNAENFYRGKTTKFSDVGFRVVDDYTFEVILVAPTPYFLWMLGHHYSWWPVHLPTIEKHGRVDDRGNRWTRPEHMVCNGPFVLSRWKVNDVIKVKRNPHYWDGQRVRLAEIHFYPIQSRDTEERAFRSGQLHVTYEIPRHKIEFYRRSNPEILRVSPYLGVYFYRVNVTNPNLKDRRVRRALAMSIDREMIVKQITKGSELPANSYTPANTAGYTPRARIPTDIDGARKLLAEAGHPDGKGLGSIEIHFNTEEKHRMVAEAIQEMWKKNLNLTVTLVNHEWKVYLDAQDTLNYHVSRAGWIGDYVDPNTFLEMWKTGDGNNDTGWSNAEYDQLIDRARLATDPQARLELFQKAEAILLEEAPVIPIYFYTKPYLLQTSVRNWHENILDHHPYKYVYLEPPAPTPAAGAR